MRSRSWAARRARNPELRLVRAAQRSIDVTPGALRQRLWALRRTDGVIVHAAAYLQALLGLGLDPLRVAHVPGSVDANRFSPGQAPELRARWGVPEERAAGGNRRPDEAGARTSRALARVGGGGAEVAPGVARARGPRRGRGGAAGAFARAWVLPRVVFGGYLRGPALVQAYRALDVAVWLREGNDGACRGVLEAMACGVPLVVGNGGAPPELVGESGRAVVPGDPAAIAAALLELLDHDGLARDLGRAARERAAQHTPRRAADATLAFWRRLRDLPPVWG